MGAVSLSSPSFSSAAVSGISPQSVSPLHSFLPIPSEAAMEKKQNKKLVNFCHKDTLV